MNASLYPAVVRELLAEDRLADLGPGRPNVGVRGKLAALTAEQLVAPGAMHSQDFAAACLAGLWLYHDFLDESHKISQDIDTSTGSFWHGILHRREPDYSNAKYWFRRVGQHPVFPAIHKAAAELARADPQAPRFLSHQTAWDPFEFVDYCEQCAKGHGDALLARRVQQREWEILFDYCYRQASGAAA
ncbi:MAG: hypothetical protein K2R98_11130 [Gemmataceae bacterium]|nr:hypothetical protein [Gemmataceae bacterium]